MTGATSVLRGLIIYVVCLPLAIFIGYELAVGSPFIRGSYVPVAVVLLVLFIPLLLRWYHAWLIITWNLAVMLFFVPGRPSASMILSIVGLMIAVGQYILNRRMKFYSAPGVTRSLIFLVVVVAFTAKMTGGIGLGAFGSASQGGMKYIQIFCAVMGYFAMVSKPIPPRKRLFYATLFMLGPITYAFGSLVATISPNFYFIYLLVPVDANVYTASQSSAETLLSRFSGYAMAGSAVYFALLIRYGVRDILSMRQPWKLALFACCGCVCMLGGFRSLMIQLLITFMVIFYLEGLMRSRYLPFFSFVGVVLVAFVLLFIRDMPLGVQRSLCFLPLEVDPIARADAEASSQWRIDMWKDVAPTIPKYLIIGKGYSHNAAELADLNSIKGIDSGMESAEMVSGYHNGPLSVLLPFGIFGVLGLIWFMFAGWRVLVNNYRYGDPELRVINRFLLAYYVARIVLFWVVFGSLFGDLALFAGVVGFSISLNAGVAKKPVAQIYPKPVQPFRFAPTAPRPAGAA